MNELSGGNKASKFLAFSMPTCKDASATEYLKQIFNYYNSQNELMKEIQLEKSIYQSSF